MSRGAPALGKVYQLKGNGNYRVRVKGVGIVDLGTDDLSLAEQKAKEPMTKSLQEKIPESQPKLTPEKLNSPSSEVVDTWLKQPSNLDTIEVSLTEKQLELPIEPVKNSTIGDDVWHPPEPVVLPKISPTLSVISGGGKKQKGLTPEQLERLSKGLYKIATKVNVVAAEACVKFMGRDPCPLDDDEIELLQMGWEMYLEESFGKSKPEPWMILLAGNAAIIFSMYIRGQKLSKESMVPSVGS
jgi:hypothetical protein